MKYKMEYKLVVQGKEDTLNLFNAEVTRHLNDGEYELVGGPVRWGLSNNYWAQALVRKT